MKNRSLFSLAAIAFTAILIATPAKAQILWGTATNVSSATDVATNGTYFDAALLQDSSGTSINGGNPLTVNGVLFNLIAHGNVSVSDPATGSNSIGDITIVSSSRIPYTTTATPGVGSPTGYNLLLDDNEYSQNSAQTIRLNNLVIGDTYQVQMWADAGPAKGGFIADLAGSNGPDSVSLNANTGQFAIGTFTATASSFTFASINDPSSVNKVNMLNAISVFDEGVASVPEPSTYVLLLSGVLALVFFRFRRSANL